MKISVIVPVYNSVKTLSALLQSLAEQEFSLANFELILVDDGSTDLTDEYKSKVVRESLFEVIWLFSPHVGPGPARNLGVDRASGDIIAFTDADCEPDCDWLMRVSELVRSNSNVIWSGSVYNSGLLIFPWRMAPVNQYGITANLAASAEIFRQFKFKNDWLGLCGSDTELLYRFEQAGGEVKKTELLRVRHPVKVYSLKQVIARAWSRQNEVRLMKDLGVKAKWQMHQMFRPVLGKHISALNLASAVLAIGLVFGGLLALAFYGFGLVIGWLWFMLYGYKLVTIQAGESKLSFRNKLLTYVYLLIYLPVMVVARIIGSVRYKYFFV